MHQEFSRARREKDRNFDGKFFFGVTTTGIFCRPSCPSPIAKEENVQYFDSIFEALNHGYRPCLRCRPDVEVSYYNGNISGSILVRRALKMICNGYLNYHSIQQLSQALHISDRHLRNLFIQNLGVPPVKIARYHKALFAKKLVTSSTHSMTDIAIASGFRSIRQFNETFRNLFKSSPSSMRLNSGTKESKSNTTLQLHYQPPFNFQQMLAFLRPRSMRGVEVVTESSYSRTFRTHNTQGYFTVQDNPNANALELGIVCDDVKCFMEVHNKVRRMFDMDTDFNAIEKRLGKDDLLRQGMDHGHVPRMPRAFDPYECIIRAILGQQVTVRAATTMATRIASKANLKTDPDSPQGLDLFFPNLDELAELDISELGLTKTRQATIATATRAILNGELSLSADQPFDQFFSTFTSLPGIGDWTANYVAMRGLGMMDAFPVGDLGIIKALTKDTSKPNQQDILQRAEAWRPYRAYATLCLWNTLSKESN